MYELFYFSVNSINDVYKEFRSFNKIIDFIHDNCFNDITCEPFDNIVYLLSYDHEDTCNNPIIIDSCIGTILDHLESMKLLTIFDEKQSKYYRRYFFQEYKSYEEAYKSALNMRETSSLCYSKQFNEKLN
jgi:hypothetical protein